MPKASDAVPDTVNGAAERLPPTAGKDSGTRIAALGRFVL